MTRLQRVDIELSTVTSVAELHAILHGALGFPDWHGANWDAITSLVEMPVQLKLHGWDGLVTRLPRDAHLMRQCLEKMTVHYPAFASQVTFD
ncbi:hypothetical protein TRE132_36840 [Pseudomonas chlororaphis subsp. aurantiaca]|uniref:barstar family protein n=1 Tax=Pseudomonas chlororaphis TaxID=587753 RepID=UPI000864F993|nr:barstar family protein [Pseudomonas chlororaphis]BAV75623.1 ribonuclease inhibitor Barstar [Pseudomonas chlororaphis subsp. aurantiaca]BBN55559.1 hypothetical protein TRE132_36840 [Pseudomonas chlororaphis subsp. aurantiaca]